MQRKGQETLNKAKPIIKAACLDILSEGKAINYREIEARVSPEVLGSLRGIIDLIQEFRIELDNS